MISALFRVAPKRITLGLAIGAFCLLASPALADPPALVGRLNFIRGTVSFQPGGVDDWSPASLNYPVSTGDRFWIDNDASAEFHVGATAIQVGHGTDFSVLQLTDEVRQFSLTQGSVAVRIRHLTPDDIFEVDTPSGAITFIRPGLYRVDVDSDGDSSRVIVRNGEAVVTDAGSAFSVYEGQSAEIYGSGDYLSYDINDAPGLDDFDRWVQGRNHREDELAEQRYISPYMTGYEDLDSYGRWQDDPGYGRVWYPTSVAVDWAPYRYGHWAWVSPWGWTWVDDSPWGFAPFHYGRWAYLGGRWGWVPGPYEPRPVYAPALVAFVGGAGFAIGGGPAVGWFPLGPREVYVPAYRVGPDYLRRVNYTNVNVTNINITNIRYVNRDVAGGVTVVPRDAFVGARPVRTSVIRVDNTQIRSARVVGQTAPIVPDRVSVLAHPVAAGQTVVAPPAKLRKKEVVARTTPPPPQASFDARRKAMMADPGKPLDPDIDKRLAQQEVTGQPGKERKIKSAVERTGNQTLKPKRSGLTEAVPVTAGQPPPKPKKSEKIKTGPDVVTETPTKPKKEGRDVTGAPDTGTPKEKKGKKEAGPPTGPPTGPPSETGTKPKKATKTGGEENVQPQPTPQPKPPKVRPQPTPEPTPTPKPQRERVEVAPAPTPTPTPKPKKERVEAAPAPTPTPTPKVKKEKPPENPQAAPTPDKQKKKDKSKGEEPPPQKPPQV